MVPPLLLIVVVLLLWQFVMAKFGLFNIPTQYLGSPAGIGHAFGTLLHTGYNGRSLGFNIGISVFRVLVGFTIGACLALPLGLLMGSIKPVNRLFGPIFNFLRPIPALAFVPVVVIWFGIGETGKIFVIAATSFLYNILAASAAVSVIRADFLRAADNFHLSTFAKLRYVVLPAAMPQIVVGLRTAMALSWAVVVAAELVAAQHGLGYIIEYASTFFQINVVYVGIIFIGLIGAGMDLAFRLIDRYALHWVGK